MDFESEIHILQRVIDALPGHVYWKDLEGRHLGCNINNAKAANLSSPKDIIGKTDYELSWRANADFIVASDKKVIETGSEIVSQEASIFPGDSFETVMLSRKMPLYDKNGKMYGIVGVSLDITELKNTQKKLEKALQESEVAVKTHRTIFQNIKHHWITAISNVLAPIRMLKMDLADNPGSIEWIEMSEKGVEQLHQHINDIMNLVESGEGIPSVKSMPFNLKQLAENVSAMFKPTVFDKKVDFTLDIEGAPELARGDNYRIERIMIYLLSNALKFDRGENKVLFSVKVTEETDRYFKINLTVTDAGKGMSDGEIVRIYEPFYRVGDSNQTIHNNPDQGVGLTVTKQYIEDIKGQIDCRSELGKGTTFMVAFRLEKSINTQDILGAIIK